MAPGPISLSASSIVSRRRPTITAPAEASVLQLVTAHLFAYIAEGVGGNLKGNSGNWDKRGRVPEFWPLVHFM
jgi:hypothetical protein